MLMISCDNHAIRKALRLSLNEMAVLCDIYKLSSNPKFGYKCIKEKKKMADWLDVSEDTIYRALKTLESMGYISRDNNSCKPTQFIYNVACCEELAIYIKEGDTELFTAKMQEMHFSSDSQNQSPRLAKSESVDSQNQRLNTNSKIEYKSKYDFEHFWSLYNKKNGKKKAQDVWNKMREEDRIKAVELMDNHKSGREARYWKDPERYLRDKRWEDEPIKQITKTNTTNYDSNNAW
jgi:predicted transcriptional regulator